MRKHIIALALLLSAGAWTQANAQVADSAAQPAGSEVTRYTLAQVAGKPLPTLIEKKSRCREDVTAGTLSLRKDGGWLLETTTREVCGDRIDEDRDSDDGSYSAEGQTLRFLDDDGEDNDDHGSGNGTDNDLDLDEFKTGTLAKDGTLTVELADGTALVFRR